MEDNIKEPNSFFTIKKSIIALIGNLSLINTPFFFIFSSISLYLEDSLVRSPMDRDLVMFIDTSTTLILSFLQTLLILLVAYNWNSRTIRITKSNIIYKKGFWKITTKTIPLSEITDFTITKNVFQELLNIGKITFVFRDKEKKISFDNVDKISEQMSNLNAIRSIIKNGNHKAQTIEKLIEGGENESVEFKSSIYYDLLTKQPNKALTETIMKSIVGFLNYQGGSILIGVDDLGKVLGLDNDFSNFRKKNPDGFEQFFNTMFMQMIGAEYRTFVKLRFHSIDKQKICMVRIIPSTVPAFLRRNGSEEFFVRTGNTTNPLKTHEMFNYISIHW